jgi:Ca-activated chloride channel family protein
MRLGSSSRWRLGTGLLVLAACAGTVCADNGPRVPTFSVGVEIVSLNLFVTDEVGRSVPGLRTDDIVVLEDGVAQPVSLFAQEEWPVRLQLLLDGSGSMSGVMPVAKRAARKLLATLRDGDEAEVVQFNRRITVLQPSTGDVAALERALESVASRGETALYNTLYIALRERARTRDSDELSRHAIVLLTDGEDTASMVSDEQVIDLARRAGVVLYPIGLLAQSEEGHLDSPVSAYFLKALARETGGRAYFPKTPSELEAAYAAISCELRALYGIGYVPLNARADGAWRRLAVKARRNDRNLVVRHRTGYYAPAGERSFRILPASVR